MTITAEVRGCTVALHQPPLASGTQGNVTVAFRFDTAWDGYARTAVFRTHGKTVLVLLENDRCALPPEAAAGGDVLLGAFGVCGDATLTTPFARLTVAAGVPTAGDAAAAVTPTLAAQLLAAYRRLTAVTAEAAAGDSAAVRVTEDVDSLHFAFTLPKGDKGDKGDKGADGRDGRDGKDGLGLTSLDKLRLQKASAAVDKLENLTVSAEAGDAPSVTASGTSTIGKEALQLHFVLPKGDKGDKGDPGADGKTPVRGTDYWTDADKAAINADIAAQLAGKVDKIDGKGLSTNDYTDADKAAVVLLGKNVTLLKEITTTEEASVIVLLDNVKIRNFFVEAEIAKAAANTSGQLILNYTDGSSVYCTITNSFDSAKANKSSYIGYDIHGMQPILCRNQSTSGISGTYAALSSFHYGNNTVSKIRYHSTDGTVVPVGSKFTVYGILED